MFLEGRERVEKLKVMIIIVATQSGQEYEKGKSNSADISDLFRSQKLNEL